MAWDMLYCPSCRNRTTQRDLVSKKTETDADQSAKPDHAIAQGLPKLPGPIVRRTQGMPKVSFGRGHDILSSNNSHKRNARARPMPALEPQPRAHRWQDSKRIWFCIHGGVNLATTTDNPMSADCGIVNDRACWRPLLSFSFSSS